MSIPLDRLYNFLDGVSGHNLIIYRWVSHGSKKLSDLTCLKKYRRTDEISLPQIIFHDQEPLNFDLYNPHVVFDCLVNDYKKGRTFPDNAFPESLRNYYSNIISKQNLYGFLLAINSYDNALLVHSEKNSEQVKKYQDKKLIPVYYWSHAIIARDWYRYAEIDPTLAVKKINFDFLIYNRSWSGTREYRLKFAEILLQEGLYKNCYMNFSPTDNGINYRNHLFVNSDLATDITNFENYFRPSEFCSNSSADYNSSDYQQCGIEVVLETLFDDSRLHLTEKILRPIACGMPFILAGTPYSLRYLHDYGFKTFGDFIDESYDQITDPYKRLCKIVTTMKDIASLPTAKKHKLYQNMQSICDYNKTRFFSNNFFQLIVNEYKDNLNSGIQQLKITNLRIKNELKFDDSVLQELSSQEQQKIYSWLQQNSGDKLNF
jgi:hypothetical protein